MASFLSPIRGFWVTPYHVANAESRRKATFAEAGVRCVKDPLRDTIIVTPPGFLERGFTQMNPLVPQD
jgi:hypothetical protein